MARFKKSDYSDVLKNAQPSYDITDSYGNSVQLSPDEAYSLLQWLSEQRNELYEFVHADATTSEQRRDEHARWLRNQREPDEW